MKMFKVILLAILLLSVQISKSQDPCIDRKWAVPYTTSWIANDGGIHANHAQHWVDYLSVKPDGTVATSCGWDEGGSNVIVYKNGKIISIPEGSGTGGWGRGSMGQAVMDGDYVYQLLSQNGCDGAITAKNINKLPQYPACGDEFTWKTVRRYKIADGKSATFSNGYGYMGDMLIAHAGLKDLVGIAILGNELFVSDASGDSVKVYDKITMSSVPLRKFKFDSGVGQLSPDNKGCMWMLQPALNKLIRFSVSTGAIQSQQITFADSINVSTFFVDTFQNRILVADNGLSQNIKIFLNIYSNPEYLKSFGENRGIFSGVQGKFDALKLFDIKGVGADASGNIYVANSTPGGGSVLQSYAPNGSILWDRKGLVFTATACADPNNLQDVYTFDKKMKLDYSKTEPGSEWKFEAYTLNRFKYPDDPRLHGGFMTSAWVKYINGKKFLFATDMYASQLAGYRFDSITDGEVAIPCLFMNIGGWNTNDTYPTKLGSDKDFIWMDLNGDGSVQENEFTFKTGFDNPYSMAIWVDSKGNIWKGIRGQGVRFIPLKEVNELGVPVYDYANSKLLDIANGAIGVDGVKRLVYDADNDELYISGFSNEKPDKRSTGEGVDSWWCMGSTVCMYKHVLDTLNSNSAVNFKNILPDWRIFVPFIPDGDPIGGTDVSAKSFTVEGDYMFIATAKNGKINVFKRTNGEYLGVISPGAAINSESGWTDVDYAINVNKTPSEYRIFIEENAFAKVVLYRVKSFETIDTYFSDLVITSFKMLDAQNKVVTNIKTGDKIHFSMTVKNVGPGISPAGSTFTDGYSIKIALKITDAETNKSLALLSSDTCKAALASGNSITLMNVSTTKPLDWVVPKGKFIISATVNSTKRIKECSLDNNTANINTYSYDTVHISVNPKNADIMVNGSAEFTAEALGNLPISYKWFINDVEQSGINAPTLSLEKINGSFNNAKIKVLACNNLGCATSKEAILKVADPYGASKPGYLLRQVWYNHAGTAISDLTSIAGYPDNADSITFINKFEVPANIAEQYGTRVSGWLIAPQTGDYTFYIASDDNGELHLSTDSFPENIEINPIAFVPEWSDPRIYTKFPEQTSASISLVEGKKYFVEALFKEEAGGDNLSVAWKLPDGTKETPIPSKSLAFYTNTPAVSVKNSELPWNNLSVYPSPAYDFVYIQTTGVSGKANISITDITGRIVLVKKVIVAKNVTVKLDLNTLKTGIYTLNLNNNNRLYNSKIVVNHKR